MNQRNRQIGVAGWRSALPSGNPAPALPADQPKQVKAPPARPDKLGWQFILLLIWLAFEFGRPPNPLGIPLLISTILVIGWLMRPAKQFTPYTYWWFVLLGVAALGIPFAANTFSAVYSTRDMAIRFLCICLPLQSMVVSVKSVRVWVYTLLGVCIYVGAWAATHGGYGPSGAGGSQDENYVAAMMGMVLPFAYFSLFVEKRVFARLLMVLSIIICVAAVALGSNPSRGGFLGLITVAAYCLWRSPRKMLGFSLIGVAGVAMVLIAGPTFWAEIGSSTDTESGTGDVRLQIWSSGLRMWQAHPIIGVGAGNFRWVLGDYQTEEQYEHFGRSLAGSIIAHSFWVEMLSELGAAGVLATGMLTWGVWSSLGKVVKSGSKRPGKPSPSKDAVALAAYSDALRAAILAILVNGIFLSLFYFSHLWLLLAVGAAVPLVYRRLPEIAGQAALASQQVARARGVQ
jgi:O-antigen ligase